MSKPTRLSQLGKMLREGQLTTTEWWEQRQIALTERQEQEAPKVAAHNAVLQAIRQGQLPRADGQPCTDCGEPAHHYHHESYDPECQLDATPLCRACHTQRHAQKDKED